LNCHDEANGEETLQRQTSRATINSPLMLSKRGSTDCIVLLVDEFIIDPLRVWDGNPDQETSSSLVP
jgi:hypothetical protein